MSKYLRRRVAGGKQAHLVNRETLRPICGNFVWGPLDVPATSRIRLCPDCAAARRREQAPT